MKYAIAITILCALPAYAFTRNNDFATIVVQPKANRSACVGGNLESITKIETGPGRKDVTSEVSLSKMQPGSYNIYYEYTKFEKTGAECGEFGGPNNIKSFQIHVDAGKVYQLSLQQDYSIKIDVLDEVPITDSFVGGILQMAGSLKLWRDTCSNLFAASRNRYARAYELSTVPRYAAMFGMDKTSSRVTNEAKSKNEQLQTLGQTDRQSKRWCDIEYFSSLDEFDYSYGSRLNDVNVFFQKSGKKR